MSLWLIAIAGALPLGAQQMRTTRDGVYTKEQAARGATLFAQHCALCHGPTLAGADGPPLTGVEFAGNWSGLTLRDLFERVRTSMPPDDPGKISAQEKADILAHVLAVGNYPAGSVELPRDAPALAQIQFAATDK